MAWIKDVVSQAPKIVYIAPPEDAPIKKIIFNPKAKKNENPWIVEYEYINLPSSTLIDVEKLMGLL